MNDSKWKRFALWCLYGLIAVIVVGFWFHTAEYDRAIFDKYSFAYFLAACFMVLLGVAISLALRFLLLEMHINLHGGRRVAIPVRVKLLSVTILAALALVAGEVAATYSSVRRRAPFNPAEFHPFLQRVPLPDPVRPINRWGFRSEEIDKTKPAGTYRIFVLGGSTVFCGEVPFEQTHCRLLEKRLREEYTHVKIEVQNAGFPAYCTPHALIQFLTNIQDFDPDLIVSYHGANDAMRSFSPPFVSHGEYQPDYGHYDGPAASLVQAYAANRSRFHLYALDDACRLFDRYWYSDLRRPRQDYSSGLEWKSLPSFRRNLRDLCSIIRSKKIELVMTSQPYCYKEVMTPEENSKVFLWRNVFPNAGDDATARAAIARGMEEYNRTSQDVAQEYDVVFVDLASVVPKTLEYFVDDFHYTPEGNRVIAEALSTAIIANRFVDRKPANVSD